MRKKGWYDKKYFRRYSHYLDRDLAEVPLFAKIGKWVSKERPKKILDIGCGLGYLLAWLVEKNKAEGGGVDTSSLAIKEAKKRYPNIKFIQSSALKLPYKDKFFDVVLMINLIEHLKAKEQKQALAEAKRILKNKGLLILSTPDPTSLYARLIIRDLTHKKELTKKELVNLVSQDFVIEELVFTNSIGRFGKKLNYLLSALFPADLALRLRQKDF